MEETITPSPETGATPQSGTPATGNTAPVGATPAAPTLTLEEAVKRLADLEQSQKNAKEEVERHRKKLSAYEKLEKEQEAAKKAAEEAQLSEVERIKKQHADLQAKYDAEVLQRQEVTNRHALETAATKLHFAHPELAYKLVDMTDLEHDEQGNVKNADKILEILLKNYPELGPLATTSSTQPTHATPAPVTPTIPAMNPGRSSFNAAANTPKPGVKPSWNDVYKRP